MAHKNTRNKDYDKKVFHNQIAYVKSYAWETHCTQKHKKLELWQESIHNQIA